MQFLAQVQLPTMVANLYKSIGLDIDRFNDRILASLASLLIIGMVSTLLLIPIAFYAWKEPGSYLYEHLSKREVVKKILVAEFAIQPGTYLLILLSIWVAGAALRQLHYLSGLTFGHLLAFLIVMVVACCFIGICALLLWKFISAQMSIFPLSQFHLSDEWTGIAMLRGLVFVGTLTSLLIFTYTYH